MPVFATEGQFSRFGSLVKMSDTPERFEFHTDVVTANEAGTPTYTLGTVLGKVTATGKFKVSVQNAADGSQNPVAIYLGDGKMGAIVDTTLVAATDTPALALTRGKVIVAKEALKLDASFGTAAQKQAAYDSLKSVGILVEASF
jgi:hypothetical protein